MNMGDRNSPVVQLRLDGEGEWYHEGVQITHERTKKLFTKSITKDKDGRYVIRIGKEEALVKVEDAPFLVTSAERMADGTIRISLNDETSEELDLQGLWIGKNNVLYCKVKNGQFHAKFKRSAYYQLAEFIEYDATQDRYFIARDGRPYYIL